MVDASASLAAWVTPAVAVVALAGLIAVEARRPLRRAVEPKGRRVARNLATGGLAQAVALPLQLAMVGPLSLLAERHDIGLLQVVGLPPWLAVILSVVLLDYTLWQWHWLNHRLPFLWRFHAVHHADLDLDASTALRFHFAELAMASFWRALQVVVLGVGPMGLSVFTLLLMASTLFHHSNVRLPLSLESRLVRVLPTPRMHGIHHSTRSEERDTNFATLLTAWDILHRTLRLDVPQESITIGLPQFRDPRELGFGKIQAMPFHAPRPEERAEAD